MNTEQKRLKIQQEDLVTRLRKQAEIRRSIPRSEPDRISDLLEESAKEIEAFHRMEWLLIQQLNDSREDVIALEKALENVQNS